MKPLTKTLFSMAIVLASCLSIPGYVSADGHANQGKFKAAESLKFDDIIPGVVAFSTVNGDREKGAHGTFVRIPAGQATPLHTHGSEYHAVVISGIFENPIKDDENSQKSLGPGSYYYVPANTPHISRCAASSPTDCLTYFYQTTPFDFAVSE